MARRKTYRIKIDGAPFFGVFLRELYGWGVKPTAYQVLADENTVITQSANVVDVATETFMKSPRLLHITTE